MQASRKSAATTLATLTTTTTNTTTLTSSCLWQANGVDYFAQVCGAFVLLLQLLLLLLLLVLGVLSKKWNAGTCHSLPQLPQAVEMQNNCNACVWQQQEKVKEKKVKFCRLRCRKWRRRRLQRGQLGMSWQSTGSAQNATTRIKCKVQPPLTQTYIYAYHRIV